MPRASFLTAVLPVLFFGAHAFAQTFSVSDEGDRIIIVIENDISYIHFFSLSVETSAGPVGLRYLATPGGQPGGCCDDSVEVWSLPDGWIALPPYAEVAEGDSVTITLHRYTGY
jgi:hypothetical protein